MQSSTFVSPAEETLAEYDTLTLWKSQGLVMDAPTVSTNTLEGTVRSYLHRVLPPTSAYGEDILSTLADFGDPLSTGARLPALCCAAVGGDPAVGHLVSVAWWLLLLAARILDDIEDALPSAADQTRLSTAQRLNWATGMQALAPLLVMELGAHGVGTGVQMELLQALHTGILHACTGEARDLGACPDTVDLATGWRTVGAKSGTPCALGCRMGARAGGGTVEQVDALEQFGYHLGIANQILDDIAGTWHPADGQDVKQGQMTLPLLYALEVLPTEEYCHLRDKVEKARTGSGGHVDLQAQLLESGALHYLLIEVVRHRQAAEEALQAVKAPPLVNQQLRKMWAVLLPGQVLESLTTVKYVDQG